MTRRRWQSRVRAGRGRTRLWICVALGLALGGVLTIGATAAAPSNDNFANPVVLAGADASRSGDTNVDATLQVGEPTTVAGSPAGASVWYGWTAPATGMVVIDTATSGFDTLLGVYTGTAVDTLGEVASNDDFVLPPGTSRVRFLATVGTFYRIKVAGYAGATGTINLHVHQAPPPSNDDFANAIDLLNGQTASRAGDTNDGATLESGEATAVDTAEAGASVWYRWTAPVTGRVTIDTATSNFDTLLGVYEGTAVGSLAEVTSNDDAKARTTSLVRFDAAIGTVYRIRVDGFAQASGTINLQLQETTPVSPANDDFANAFALPSVMSTSQSGDTNAGASLETETGEPTLVAGVPAGASVWYSWIAPGPGTVTIDTATSDFDTLVGVYTGSAVGSLTGLASNDDVGTTDLTSSVRFQATSGTEYHIRVDGYAGATGAITLHLNENLPPANDDFVHAFVLSGPNDSRTNDTNLAATLQAGEAFTVAGQSASTSVWYFWNAPETTAVTIDTANSDFDTLLGVYTQTTTPATVDALSEVASNDNAGASDTTSKVAFAATAGTVYRIRVDGHAGATGTIKLHVALATVSDVPTNVTATPGNGQATVSWSAPTSDGGSPITGYDVTRYTTGQAAVTTSVGDVTQTTVDGLTNGTTYTFRVAARNAAGTGGQSTDSNPVTPSTVPDAPTSVSATAGAGQATVNWSAPVSDGGSPITQYAVTRYTAGAPPVTTTVGPTTQAIIGGLTNGTTYTFRVAAKNIAGTGAQSTESNAVTPKTVPAAPTNVTATVAAEQATVSWVASASDGGSAITGYDVTRYVGGLPYGTSSVGVVTQTTVTGLTNGTTYTFRVAAKNAAGTGPKSADSNPVTLNASRLTLTITKSGTGSGTVTSSVGGINCGASCSGDFAQGSSVMLTASASSGSTFAGWSGACAGMSSCIVTIDAARTATARFDRIEQQQQAPGRKCIVPNVKRKPLAKAKRRIAAAHCRTGKVTKAKSKTVPKGTVISQKPSAGKKLAAGSKVKLVVSRGKR